MEEESASLVAQFLSVDGEIKGPQIYLPIDTTPDQLQVLLNNLLENVRVSKIFFDRRSHCCNFLFLLINIFKKRKKKKHITLELENLRFQTI